MNFSTFIVNIVNTTLNGAKAFQLQQLFDWLNNPINGNNGQSVAQLFENNVP